MSVYEVPGYSEDPEYFLYSFRKYGFRVRRGDVYKRQEQGIYPAVDPLDSTSRILEPAVVGEEHYQVARKVQAVSYTHLDVYKRQLPGSSAYEQGRSGSISEYYKTISVAHAAYFAG